MKNLKFLHVCTIDTGGAFNGAKRQHEMLIEHGFESKILVRTKLSDNSDVYEALSGKGVINSKLKNGLNLVLKKGEVKRDRFGTDISKHPLVKEADIIILHWISTFLAPKEILKLTKLENKKIYFFMHDMWLFTGGCHVDRRCCGYEKKCIACPMAGKWASISFNYKYKYLRKADFFILGPSHWIVNEAKKSIITENKDVLYLPNTFDSKVFYPRECVEDIKKKYGFSTNKRLIMFAAADVGIANRNKGFGYLLEALKLLDMSDKQFVVIGKYENINVMLEGYDYVTMGMIYDEDILAQIYSACDVFVNPSLQESFGYTVCESMACGTPSVAFAVGGMLDQIKSMENGYLSDFCNVESLADGINYVLENLDRLSANAAISAKRFSYDNVGNGIIEILSR